MSLNNPFFFLKSSLSKRTSILRQQSFGWRPIFLYKEARQHLKKLSDLWLNSYPLFGGSIFSTKFGYFRRQPSWSLEEPSHVHHYYWTNIVDNYLRQSLLTNVTWTNASMKNVTFTNVSLTNGACTALSIFRQAHCTMQNTHCTMPIVSCKLAMHIGPFAWIL